MKCFRNFIRSFDYFGYIPQFRINGDTIFTSIVGGLISILFLIFALSYFFLEFYLFIKNRDKVQTIIISTKPSEKQYNLTIKDLYFGIGLVDNNQSEKNYKDFSYLEFKLNLVTLNSDNGITNKTRLPIPLGKCNLSLFINKIDLLKIDNTTQLETSSKLNNYLCPLSNMTFSISPDKFENGHVYLDFSLDLNNTSNLSYASDDLNIKRPRLNFIYKQIGLDINNKIHPFQSYIENFFTNIDFDFAKKTEIVLYPKEIMDDSSTFNGNSYDYFNDSDTSSLKNGSIFTFFRSSDFFERIWDRTIPIPAHDGKPWLALSKFFIRISPSTGVFLRTYSKFSMFLAGISAILSNSLIVFVIVMNQVNLINGKNLLLESMFSYDIIQNIMKFNKDVKIDIKEVRTQFYKINSLDTKRIRSNRAIPNIQELSFDFTPKDQKINLNEFLIPDSSVGLKTMNASEGNNHF